MAKAKTGQPDLKEIDTAKAAKLYNKDQRTIRRWCEQHKVKCHLDPGGNWVIQMPVEEYERRMVAVYSK